MVGFYRRDFAPTAAQVIHSACVRSFDEGQAPIAFVTLMLSPGQTRHKASFLVEDEEKLPHRSCTPGLLL
jgi:hypothetical protein